MRCSELAKLIETIRPEATPEDVARLCLMLALSTNAEMRELLNGGGTEKNPDEVMQRVVKAWREANIGLRAATDQHSAMTEQLEDLARSEPQQFTPDQIWVLTRAIKVQSQILELYVGKPK
jgi:hypothetical protein